MPGFYDYLIFYRYESDEVRLGRLLHGEMLDELRRQIAGALLITTSKSAAAITQRRRQAPAPQSHVRSIVGQAEAARAGQHHKIVVDDARLSQLAQDVQLAAREDLVTEVHIPLLLFAASPAGEARRHEELAVKGIRDAFVQFVLPLWRQRGGIDQSPLSVAEQIESILRVSRQQLGEKKSFGGLLTGGLTHSSAAATARQIERARLWPCIIADERSAEPQSHHGET